VHGRQPYVIAGLDHEEASTSLIGRLREGHMLVVGPPAEVQDGGLQERHRSSNQLTAMKQTVGQAEVSMANERLF
jgi:hypothetical protein